MTDTMRKRMLKQLTGSYGSGDLIGGDSIGGYVRWEDLVRLTGVGPKKILGKNGRGRPPIKLLGSDLIGGASDEQCMELEKNIKKNKRKYLKRFNDNANADRSEYGCVKKLSDWQMFIKNGFRKAREYLSHGSNKLVKPKEVLSFMGKMWKSSGRNYNSAMQLLNLQTQY